MADQLGSGDCHRSPREEDCKTPSRALRISNGLTIISTACAKLHETTVYAICMENMEPVVNSLLCTPERMRELLDAEPWLFFTLDVSHALMKDEKEPARYIELCHDRLRNVHISRVVRGKPHFRSCPDPRDGRYHAGP